MEGSSWSLLASAGLPRSLCTSPTPVCWPLLPSQPLAFTWAISPGRTTLCPSKPSPTALPKLGPLAWSSVISLACDSGLVISFPKGTVAGPGSQPDGVAVLTSPSALPRPSSGKTQSGIGSHCLQSHHCWGRPEEPYQSGNQLLHGPPHSR